MYLLHTLLPLHSVSSPFIRKGEDSFYLSCVCPALESKARLKHFQKRWSAEWLRGLYIDLWIYMNTEVLYQASPDFLLLCKYWTGPWKQFFLRHCYLIECRGLIANLRWKYIYIMVNFALQASHLKVDFLSWYPDTIYVLSLAVNGDASTYYFFHKILNYLNQGQSELISATQKK